LDVLEILQQLVPPQQPQSKDRRKSQ